MSTKVYRLGEDYLYTDLTRMLLFTCRSVILAVIMKQRWLSRQTSGSTSEVFQART